MATENAPQKRFTAQQIASHKKALRKQRIVVIGGSVLAMVILLALIIGMTLYPDTPTDDGRILPNVYAAGINLGGMTLDQARSQVHLATINTVSKKDMVIQLPDTSIRLSPQDTRAALDVNAVVEEAYRYGRTGTEKENQRTRKLAEKESYHLALLPYMRLDIDYIRSTIDHFAASYGTRLTQPEISVSGQAPTYDPENPNAAVKHQVLTIKLGTPDYRLDADELYDRVLDAYSMNQLSVTYDVTSRAEPEIPSAEKLFRRYCTAPTDASITSYKYYEIEPEIYGYGFDIDALQKQIDEAPYGQTLRVTLGFLMPEVTAKSLSEGLFKDVLASYTSSNPSGNTNNRNTNLALSCAAINGIVLQPGEEFSFNESVGRPTAEKGYKKAPIYRRSDAPIYREGAVVEELGGGISQTASALYYCALLADLDILERHNNGCAINYIELGLDAYVEWGIKDLRIRNNTDSLIRIVASADGGNVSMELVGVDNKDYTVSITTEKLSQTLPETINWVVDKDNVQGYQNGYVKQPGLMGYEIQTTTNRHLKSTGQLITSMPIDISVYNKRNIVIVWLEELPVPDPIVPEDPQAPTDPQDPTAPAVPQDPTEPSPPAA